MEETLNDVAFPNGEKAIHDSFIAHRLSAAWPSDLVIAMSILSEPSIENTDFEGTDPLQFQRALRRVADRAFIQRIFTLQTKPQPVREEMLLHLRYLNPDMLYIPQHFTVPGENDDVFNALFHEQVISPCFAAGSLGRIIYFSTTSHAFYLVACPDAMGNVHWVLCNSGLMSNSIGSASIHPLCAEVVIGCVPLHVTPVEHATQPADSEVWDPVYTILVHCSLLSKQTVSTNNLYSIMLDRFVPYAKRVALATAKEWGWAHATKQTSSNCVFTGYRLALRALVEIRNNGHVLLRSNTSTARPLGRLPTTPMNMNAMLVDLCMYFMWSCYTFDFIIRSQSHMKADILRIVTDVANNPKKETSQVWIPYDEPALARYVNEIADGIGRAIYHYKTHDISKKSPLMTGVSSGLSEHWNQKWKRLSVALRDNTREAQFPKPGSDVQWGLPQSSEARQLWTNAHTLSSCQFGVSMMRMRTLTARNHGVEQAVIDSRVLGITSRSADTADALRKLSAPTEPSSYCERIYEDKNYEYEDMSIVNDWIRPRMIVMDNYTVRSRKRVFASFPDMSRVNKVLIGLYTHSTEKLVFEEDGNGENGNHGNSSQLADRSQEAEVQGQEREKSSAEHEGSSARGHDHEAGDVISSAGVIFDDDSSVSSARTQMTRESSPGSLRVQAWEGDVVVVDITIRYWSFREIDEEDDITLDFEYLCMAYIQCSLIFLGHKMGTLGVLEDDRTDTIPFLCGASNEMTEDLFKEFTRGSNVTDWYMKGEGSVNCVDVTRMCSVIPLLLLTPHLPRETVMQYQALWSRTMTSSAMHMSSTRPSVLDSEFVKTVPYRILIAAYETAFGNRSFITQLNDTEGTQHKDMSDIAAVDMAFMMSSAASQQALASTLASRFRSLAWFTPLSSMMRSTDLELLSHACPDVHVAVLISFSCLFDSTCAIDNAPAAVEWMMTRLKSMMSTLAVMYNKDSQVRCDRTISPITNPLEYMESLNSKSAEVDSFAYAASSLCIFLESIVTCLYESVKDIRAMHQRQEHVEYMITQIADLAELGHRFVFIKLPEIMAGYYSSPAYEGYGVMAGVLLMCARCCSDASKWSKSAHVTRALKQASDMCAMDAGTMLALYTEHAQSNKHPYNRAAPLQLEFVRTIDYNVPLFSDRSYPWMWDLRTVNVCLVECADIRSAFLRGWESQCVTSSIITASNSEAGIKHLLDFERRVRSRNSRYETLLQGSWLLVVDIHHTEYVPALVCTRRGLEDTYQLFRLYPQMIPTASVVEDLGLRWAVSVDSATARTTLVYSSGHTKLEKTSSASGIISQHLVSPSTDMTTNFISMDNPKGAKLVIKLLHLHPTLIDHTRVDTKAEYDRVCFDASDTVPIPNSSGPILAMYQLFRCGLSPESVTQSQLSTSYRAATLHQNVVNVNATVPKPFLNTGDVVRSFEVQHTLVKYNCAGFNNTTADCIRISSLGGTEASNVVQFAVLQTRFPLAPLRFAGRVRQIGSDDLGEYNIPEKDLTIHWKVGEPIKLTAAFICQLGMPYYMSCLYDWTMPDLLDGVVFGRWNNTRPHTQTSVPPELTIVQTSSLTWTVYANEGFVLVPLSCPRMWPVYGWSRPLALRHAGLFGGHAFVSPVAWAPANGSSLGLRPVDTTQRSDLHAMWPTYSKMQAEDETSLLLSIPAVDVQMVACNRHGGGGMSVRKYGSSIQVDRITSPPYHSLHPLLSKTMQWPGLWLSSSEFVYVSGWHIDPSIRRVKSPGSAMISHALVRQGSSLTPGSVLYCATTDATGSMCTSTVEEAAALYTAALACLEPELALQASDCGGFFISGSHVFRGVEHLPLTPMLAAASISGFCNVMTASRQIFYSVSKAKPNYWQDLIHRYTMVPPCYRADPYLAIRFMYENDSDAYQLAQDYKQYVDRVERGRKTVTLTWRINQYPSTRTLKPYLLRVPVEDDRISAVYDLKNHGGRCIEMAKPLSFFVSPETRRVRMHVGIQTRTGGTIHFDGKNVLHICNHILLNNSCTSEADVDVSITEDQLRSAEFETLSPADNADRRVLYIVNYPLAIESYEVTQNKSTVSPTQTNMTYAVKSTVMSSPADFAMEYATRSVTPWSCAPHEDMSEVVRQWNELGMEDIIYAMSTMNHLVKRGAGNDVTTLRIPMKSVLQACRASLLMVGKQRNKNVRDLFAFTYSERVIEKQELGLRCVPSAACLRCALIQNGNNNYRFVTVAQKQVVGMLRACALVRKLTNDVPGVALRWVGSPPLNIDLKADIGKFGLTCVECIRGYFASAAQISLVHEMCEATLSRDNVSQVWEQIMGSGKSSVIGPAVVAELVLAQGKYVTCAVPDFMSADATRLMFMPVRFFSSPLSFSGRGNKSVLVVSQNAARTNIHKGTSGGQHSTHSQSSSDLDSLLLACEFHTVDILRGGMSVIQDTALRLGIVTDDRGIFNLTSTDWRFVMLVDEYDMLTQPNTSELNVPLDPRVNKNVPAHVEYVFKVLSCLLSRRSVLKNITCEPEGMLEVIAAANTATPGCVTLEPMVLVNDMNAFYEHLSPWICSAFPVPVSILQGQSDRTYVTQTIGSILSMSYRVQYGSCQCGEKDTSAPAFELDHRIVSSRDLYNSIKHTFECVPYKAKDVPLRGSRFGDLSFRVSGSCMTKILSGLTSTEAHLVLVRVKNWLVENDVRGDLALMQMFTGKNIRTKHAFLSEMQSQCTLRSLVSIARYQYYAAKIFCTLYLSEALSETTDLKLTTNGASVYACPVAFRKRIGFTGTPSSLKAVWFRSDVQESPPVAMTMPSVHVDEPSRERIRHALSSKEVNVTTMVVSENGADLESALLTAASDLAISGALVAVIDAGALVLKLDNMQFATSLAAAVRDRINAMDASSIDNNIPELVFYIDDKERPQAVRISNGRHVDPSLYSYDRGIMYYDNAHLTGVDRLLRSDGLGLITISRHTTWRDLSQGAFRLRQLGTPGGQRLVTFSGAPFANYVRSKGYDITRPDSLVAYMIEDEKQADQRLQLTVFQHCAHALLNHVRTVLVAVEEFELPENLFSVPTRGSDVVSADPGIAIKDCRLQLMNVREHIRTLSIAYPLESAANCDLIGACIGDCERLEEMYVAAISKGSRDVHSFLSGSCCPIIYTQRQQSLSTQVQTEAESQVQTQIHVDVDVDADRYVDYIRSMNELCAVDDKHALDWENIDWISKSLNSMHVPGEHYHERRLRYRYQSTYQYGEPKVSTRVDVDECKEDTGTDFSEEEASNSSGDGTHAERTPSSSSLCSAFVSSEKVELLLQDKRIFKPIDRVLGLNTDDSLPCSVWIDESRDPSGHFVWILYVPHPSFVWAYSLLLLSHAQVVSLLIDASQFCQTPCVLMDIETTEPICVFPYGRSLVSVLKDRPPIRTDTLDAVLTLAGRHVSSPSLLSRSFAPWMTVDNHAYVQSLTTNLAMHNKGTIAAKQAWTFVRSRLMSERQTMDDCIRRILNFADHPTQDDMAALFKMVMGELCTLELKEIDPEMVPLLSRMLSIGMLRVMGVSMTPMLPFVSNNVRGLYSASKWACFTNTTLGSLYAADKVDITTTLDISTLLSVCESTNVMSVFSGLAKNSGNICTGGGLYAYERDEIQRQCQALAAVYTSEAKRLVEMFVEACSTKDDHLPLRLLAYKPYGEDPSNQSPTSVTVFVPRMSCAPVRATYVWLMWTRSGRPLPVSLGDTRGSWFTWIDRLPLCGVVAADARAAQHQMLLRLEKHDKLTMLTLGVEPRSICPVFNTPTRVQSEAMSLDSGQMFVLLRFDWAAVGQSPLYDTSADVDIHRVSRKRSRLQAQPDAHVGFVYSCSALCAADSISILKKCAPQHFNSENHIEAGVHYVGTAIPPRAKIVHAHIERDGSYRIVVSMRKI